MSRSRQSLGTYHFPPKRKLHLTLVAIVRPEKSSNELRREAPTAVDSLVVGVSPILIIGMISCLVFFLVIVVYQGEFTQRLMYILGLYTFASVFTARIAIEKSRAAAFSYTLILALATFVVANRFAALPASFSWLNLPFLVGLLALIGFLADRLTFDCTLIEEAEGGTSVGLLQSLGVISNPASSSSDNDDARTTSEKSTRRAKHNPGVWVLYFALMAVPLFGLGQLAIPASDPESRRWAFQFLFGYLFFAMSLLVVSSFLGMRRYLRHRKVPMPPQLNAVWIGGGLAGVFVILMVVALTPLPSGEFGMFDLPFQLETTFEHQPSRLGWGNEGVDEQSPSNQQSNATSAKSGSRSSDQSSQDESNATNSNKETSGTKANPDGAMRSEKNDSSNNGSSQSSKNGEPTSSSKSNQNSQASGQPTPDAKSPQQSTGENQGESSENSKSKSDGKTESGGGKDQTTERARSDAIQEGERNPSSDPKQSSQALQRKQDATNVKTNGSQQSGTRGEEDFQKNEESQESNSSQPKNEPTSTDEPSSDQPWSSPRISISLFGGLENLFRWIVTILIALALLYLFWRYRDEWATLFASVLRWWQSLFDRPDGPEATTAASPVAPAVPSLKRFADFENPFATRLRSWPPERILQHTFQAMEAWGRERNLQRDPEETPQEYLQRLMKQFPDHKELLAQLGSTYNRVAYAGQSASANDVQPLQRLWSWMTQTAVLIAACIAVYDQTAYSQERQTNSLCFAVQDWNGASRGEVTANTPPQWSVDGCLKSLEDLTSKMASAQSDSDKATTLASEVYRELTLLHCFTESVPKKWNILTDRSKATAKLDVVAKSKSPLPELGWPAGFTVISSKHFQLLTQASPKIANDIIRLSEQNFEIWKQLYFSFWCSAQELNQALQHNRPLVEAKPESKFRIVLFRDRESYVRQLSKVEPNIALSTGFYSAKLNTVFCYWDASNSEATLRHELTHQFFHEASSVKAIDPRDLNSDFWLIEALALFAESADITDADGYDIVKLGGWDSSRLQAARYRRLHDQFWIDWDEFRKANTVPFQSSETAKMWYSQAAGLGHLLMESEEHRPLFLDYAKSVIRGSPEPKLLQDWNESETLRKAYDRFLLSIEQERRWFPTSAKRNEFVLSRTNVDSATLLAWPEAFREADWLDLSFCPIDDSLFRESTSTKSWNIRRLNLESTNVSDASLPLLSRMSRLEELDLSRCQISDTGLRSLQGQTSLRNLWLTECTEVTDASLPILESLPRLEFIDLTKTQVTAEGWKRLIRTKPRLKAKSKVPQ